MSGRYIQELRSIEKTKSTQYIFEANMLYATDWIIWLLYV